MGDSNEPNKRFLCPDNGSKVIVEWAAVKISDKTAGELDQIETRMNEIRADYVTNRAWKTPMALAGGSTQTIKYPKEKAKLKTILEEGGTFTIAGVTYNTYKSLRAELKRYQNGL